MKEKCKILVTRSLLNEDLQYISDGIERLAGENAFELILPVTYDEDELCMYCQDADVVLGSFVTEKMIKQAEKLKLIQVPWTGMDTFPFHIMKNSDVVICNSHSNALAVAEFGIALILDMIKKISYHDRKLRQGSWNRDQTPLSLKSRMLAHQDICILGYGQIGSRLGNILQAFGAKITAVDNHIDVNHPHVVKTYSGEDRLLAIANADIVVCTLPLTKETEKLIDAEAIERLKPQAILINLSRAEIFDENALYNALTTKRISGFASDVWWQTPGRGKTYGPVSCHKFESLENVLLSPHRAGFIEGELPHLDDAIQNIVNLINGNPFINVVDPTRGY